MPSETESLALHLVRAPDLPAARSLVERPKPQGISDEKGHYDQSN
jgi:hypothetical protein